jgi:hypothetical protein
MRDEIIHYEEDLAYLYERREPHFSQMYIIIQYSIINDCVLDNSMCFVGNDPESTQQCHLYSELISTNLFIPDEVMTD